MRYDPPTVTGTGVMPGTVLLRDELRRLWPSRNIVGGYNARCTQFHPTKPGDATCQFGHRISHHAESRAIDVMTTEVDVHLAITAWALGMDGERWGVQEVITGYPSPRRWTVDTGWKPYAGPSSHRDHVHLSQTIAAAKRTTVPTQPSRPSEPIDLGDTMHITDVTVLLDADGNGWKPVPNVNIEEASSATILVPNPPETGRYIAPAASARLANKGGQALVVVTDGPPTSAIYVRVCHR
jgi:hypothetical protein